MKNVSLKIRQFLSGNAFQVAITFLVSGFLAGSFFNSLTLLCSKSFSLCRIARGRRVSVGMQRRV
jgi:hypothetical protein